MTNIFKKLGIGLVDFGKWLGGAVADTIHLAAKIETLLKAEKPLEAPFVAGLSKVVVDVEALIAACGSAVSTQGLNFAADSQAYQQFLTLIADFKALAPTVSEAIQIIEGKAPAPAAVTATANKS